MLINSSLMDRYSLRLNYKVPKPFLCLYYVHIREPLLLLYYTYMKFTFKIRRFNHRLSDSMGQYHNEAHMGFLLQAVIFGFVDHFVWESGFCAMFFGLFLNFFKVTIGGPNLIQCLARKIMMFIMVFLPLTLSYVDCRDCLQQSCVETLNFTTNIPFTPATQPKLQIIKQHTLTRPYLI